MTTKQKYLSELPWKDSYIDLISPLIVEIESDFRCCAVWNDDLNITGTGLDEDAALREFALTLENIVDSLRSVTRSHLSVDQLKTLEHLETYLPLDEEIYE